MRFQTDFHLYGLFFSVREEWKEGRIEWKYETNCCEDKQYKYK